MGARNRNDLGAAASSESQMTYTRFLELFPDHGTCLDYLRDRFYPAGSPCPSCDKATKFHRIKDRSAFACQYCRHQVYPTANTIFHKSTVSLQLWFWAIFLMSSTRCGISAKQLEREIGVTYKTAHRMFKQIRSLLADDHTDDNGEVEQLTGEVEIDETYWGGKPRLGDIRSRQDVRKWQDAKTPVLGMVQRGGSVRAIVLPDKKGVTIKGRIREHVLPESMIFTDEWSMYVGIGREYMAHKRVHHKARVYVDGDATTNMIEGFFGLLKNGVRGVYHSVSRQYLQSYLDEYAFRYNRRDGSDPIFWAILNRVRKGDLGAA